jgi:hypothetical protein
VENKWDAANAEAGKKVAVYCRAEGADAKQAQAQHGNQSITKIRFGDAQY